MPGRPARATVLAPTARVPDTPPVRRTIPSLFRRTVEATPDALWLATDEATFTYGEALQHVERAAAWLRTSGVARGDRVLVTAANRWEVLLSWLALMELGAVQVPVNPASAESELTGLCRQVAPRMVVTVPEARPSVLAASHETATPVVEVEVLFGAEPDRRGPVPVDPDDVAVMIPTSGTTGRSKLVMQTHRAYVMAGEGFPWWMGLGRDDRLMTSLPLFHINAPAYSTLGSVAAGAGLVLLPRFSASGFLDAARRFGATEFNAIGAMLEILMRQPERPDDADNPLRLGYTGPSPPKERHLEIERRFGLELVCGYGLSESPYGLIWRRPARPFGALGSARQHPELGHVNDARIHDPGPDGVGELELRNPAVMRGYFEMPEETDAVLVDGWLRTGDLVTDDGTGTFTFVGRRKEVIRRRGENLSPTEVEAVLGRHPDVAEVAVVGVPSELSEQDVKAFVVPAADAPIDVHTLDALVREHLAPFKAPRYYELVQELPHTPTGRVAKHELSLDRTADETDLEREERRG